MVHKRKDRIPKQSIDGQTPRPEREHEPERPGQGEEKPCQNEATHSSRRQRDAQRGPWRENAGHWLEARATPAKRPAKLTAPIHAPRLMRSRAEQRQRKREAAQYQTAIGMSPNVVPISETLAVPVNPAAAAPIANQFRLDMSLEA